jgi:hypothetical protein
MTDNDLMPNNLMYFILARLEDLVGKNGTDAVLKYAGLDRFIGNYPPCDFNMVEPMENIYAIVRSLMDIYGENGYLSLIRGVGTQTFFAMLMELPWLLEVEDGAMDGLSPKEQFKLMYKTYNEKWAVAVGVHTKMEILEDQIIDSSSECTSCRGLKATRPICIHVIDFYKGMAKYLNVEKIHIEETRCMAVGDDVCQFVMTFG